jgi:predicted transcriptional regulator of viral defense system
MIKLTFNVSLMRTSASNAFYDLASEHGGYFTTREALQAGLSYRRLSYHVLSGELERVSHGVYRLVNYPAHRHGDMITATLWAGPDSAISHESALAVYGLASAMPAVIHLTAPSTFTGSRQGVRIHHAYLEPDERRLWDDVPVTTVERSLIDIAQGGDSSLLHDAVSDSLAQGLTTRLRLARAVARSAHPAEIRRALGIRLPAVKEAAA